MLKTKFRKASRLLAGSLLVLLLILISFVSFKTLDRLFDTSKSAEETTKAIKEMEGLIASLRDAEGSHRKFIVTQDRSFLKPAFRSYSEALEKLALVQKTNIGDKLIDLKADSLREIINSRIDPAKKEIKAGFYSHTADSRYQIFEQLDSLVDTRRMVREMQLKRFSLLTQTATTQARYSNYATVLSILGALFVLLMTIFLFRSLEKNFDLQIEYDREKTMSEKKGEFLTSVSHELKTPLTSMKGYLQIIGGIIRKKDYKEIEPFLYKASRQVDRLDALVRDLVTVSKLQAQKMNYNFTEFNLKDLIDDLVVYGTQLGPGYKIRVNGEADIKVCGDRNRLEQAVGNVISNAVKYSRPGSEVIIDIAVNNKEVKLSISDFGIGISAENLDRIFERYFRAEENNNNYSGLGIGLYISSEITKAHGGSMLVESVLGKGSTFVLLFPITV